MLSAANLRNRIAALVNGDISLDAFEDWFTVVSWNAHKDSSPVAVELVGAVELRLDEYSSGHLSFDEMSRELEAMVLEELLPVFSSANSNIAVSMSITAAAHPQPWESWSSSVASRVLVPVPA